MAQGGSADGGAPSDDWAARGMLHPQLAGLLRAVQLARVFDDSKAAV